MLQCYQMKHLTLKQPEWFWDLGSRSLVLGFWWIWGIWWFSLINWIILLSWDWCLGKLIINEKGAHISGVMLTLKYCTRALKLLNSSWVLTNVNLSMFYHCFISIMLDPLMLMIMTLNEVGSRWWKCGICIFRIWLASMWIILRKRRGPFLSPTMRRPVVLSDYRERCCFFKLRYKDLLGKTSSIESPSGETG